MERNVLIISSSPRKDGNSEILCSEFARGASEKGHKVETVFLNEHDINYCSGCGNCAINKGQCLQEDDMVEIKEKMIQADIIVFATPIYFYTMTGQLKTFIDRNCAFYSKLKNKKFYIILTSADEVKSQLDRVLNELDGYIKCLENPTVKGVVYGVGTYSVGDVLNTSAMEEAYSMGAEIE